MGNNRRLTFSALIFATTNAVCPTFLYAIINQKLTIWHGHRVELTYYLVMLWY